jgi:uncharacterized protein (DUF1786 family)
MKAFYMKHLRKILAIDIGAGTQDILLYNDELNTENCISLILPTPTRYYAGLIDKSHEDLFIEGDPIGGGAISSLLKKHLKKGYRVIMSADAAFTVRNNLNEVRNCGIEISNGALHGFQGEKLQLQEVNFPHLKAFLCDYGEDFVFDLAAIAVQDHGTPEEGVSNREFRFKEIEKRLHQDNRPEAFMYSFNEIPDYFKRMKAVAKTAMSQLECEVMVMDTSFAAILGCMEEVGSSLYINAGNSHTLVASISGGRIDGLMEHHTGCLNTEKLDDLLMRFMKSEVTSKEILDDGGHGAVIISSNLTEKSEIVATGPNRVMLKDSRFSVRFAAPYGNMMLTGPFGLVKGAKLKYEKH